VVNGTPRQISLPATANWDTWGTTAQSVTLASGSNTLALKFGANDSGNLNLDNIAVTPADAPAAGTLEAESAQLSGGAVGETEHPGYTGTGLRAASPTRTRATRPRASRSARPPRARRR
jgi:hypothetical protein